MTVEKKKARSSGATPERDRERDLAKRANLYFRGYSTTDRRGRQFLIQ